jgi:ankyrin repeat protein
MTKRKAESEIIVKKDINDNRELTWVDFVNACINGELDIIKQAIKQTFNVNSIIDPQGWTALHHACCHNYLEIFQELIKAGADIEIKDRNGETPLLYAIRYGRVVMFRELIKENANLEIKNNEGSTAISLAFHHNHEVIKKELMACASYPSLKKLLERFKINEESALYNRFHYHLNELAYRTNIHLTKIDRIYWQLIKKIIIGQTESNSILSALPRDMMHEIVKSLKLLM